MKKILKERTNKTTDQNRDKDKGPIASHIAANLVRKFKELQQKTKKFKGIIV